jgi:hypothetical protein
MALTTIEALAQLIGMTSGRSLRQLTPAKPPLRAMVDQW